MPQPQSFAPHGGSLAPELQPHVPTSTPSTPLTTSRPLPLLLHHPPTPYSRDALSGPIRQLEQMLQQIREGSFLPDATRSGYFVRENVSEAAPSWSMVSESPTLARPMSTTWEGPDRMEQVSVEGEQHGASPTGTSLFGTNFRKRWLLMEGTKRSLGPQKVKPEQFLFQAIFSSH